MGTRYGRLTVCPGLSRFTRNGRAFYIAQCDCGVVKVVREDSLKGGKTTSCGCYGLEQRTNARITHHKCGTVEYSTWEAIKQRCLNSRHKQYDVYGGAGKSICKRWLKFENFLEDMGERPTSPGYWGIDRIDNNKGYFKENCRWVLGREQVLNRDVTRWITYKGETRCISEWAKLLKVSRSRLNYRLGCNWPIDLAFTLPSNAHIKKFVQMNNMHNSV